MNKQIKWLEMDYDDILIQVKDCYDRWYFFVNNKREEFDVNLKLYNDQKKQSSKEKVWDTTVYNVHSALMARLYMWKTEVLFEWKEIWDEAITDNINSAYKEDFESEYMEKIKYRQIWSTLFYWVGIVAKKWWDWQEKRASFQYVDPRLWIPDPDWDYFSWEYSFTWFERLISKSELKASWLWHQDLQPIPLNWNSYKWADKIKRDDNERNWLNSYNWGSAKSEMYNIYYHWWIFWNKKALVITWNDNTLIIWTKVLEPTLECEKKDFTKIPFPFVFTYYRPDGTPFGKNIVDDTGNVQRVKAIIANLRLDKAKAELYPMYLRNTRLIKNKTDLDFGFNKIIDVNPLEWEPINNAIQPLNKDFRADNSYLIENSLDQQVERATSIWAIAQGSDPQRRETATTNKLVQWNTDINLNLTAKILNMWFKQMAELRYRGILEYMTNWDKKSVKFYNGMTYVPLRLSRKDLVRDWNVKVIVKSDAEITQKRQKEINAFNMALPILQASWIDKFSLNYAYRDFLRNLWYDEKKVWAVIKETPEETIIKQHIEALNAGAKILPDENTNIDAALLLIKSANPWLNTDLYIMKLLEMYNARVWAWLEQWWNQQLEAMRNNVAAQAWAWLQNLAQEFTW